MTDAIVLKTSPYSESTLIVWLLTREQGAVRVLAKGARRLKGHTAAAFDLFSHVQVSLRMPAREGLGILRSVDLKKPWMFLRTDLKLLAMASVGLEILGTVASASAPETFFFDQAIEYMNILESAAAPGSLTAALLLRLLHHSGHPPRMDDGLEGQALPATLAYDFDSGTIVDRATSRAGAAKHMPLSRRLVEQIHAALEIPPSLDGSFVVSSQEGAELLRWLIRIWSDHLNQPIRSASFLEKVGLESATPKRA